MTQKSRLAAGSAALALAATSLLTVAPAATAHSQAVTKRLDATLRPTSAGDPDGAGHAVVRLTRATGKVCATVTWRRIGTPGAAHIHQRSDGAVVVDLTGAVTGGSHCATGVKRTLITKILLHPRRYYVNVHNTKYPAGAIRGNLHY